VIGANWRAIGGEWFADAGVSGGEGHESRGDSGRLIRTTHVVWHDTYVFCGDGCGSRPDWHESQIDSYGLGKVSPLSAFEADGSRHDGCALANDRYGFENEAGGLADNPSPSRDNLPGLRRDSSEWRADPCQSWRDWDRSAAPVSFNYARLTR
jgi:hypothetical protein